MTSTELLTIASSLLVLLISLLAYIGQGMITELKKIATSVNKIEIDLGILSNDHANLKESVGDIKERVLALER